MQHNSNWNTGHTNHFGLEMGWSIEFILLLLFFLNDLYDCGTCYIIWDTFIVLFTFVSFLVITYTYVVTIMKMNNTFFLWSNQKNSIKILVSFLFREQHRKHFNWVKNFVFCFCTSRLSKFFQRFFYAYILLLLWLLS